MGIEYEFKYKADYDTLVSINNSYPQKAEVIEMETVYFDTPTGAYTDRHYTLRRRKENDKYICTLKTPAKAAEQEWKDEVSAQFSYHRAPIYLAGSARNEWEVECEKIEDAFPLLVEQGAPEEVWRLAATEGLKSICGAKFTRLSRTINLHNSVIEVDIDSGYLFGGGKSEPFYEVEFEVKSGDKVEAGYYISKVALEYDLDKQPLSKFARALKLYKGE